MLGAPFDSPLSLAWRQTGVFWSQTFHALARHPLPIFACAAVPAVERCFVLLHGTRLSRGSMAAMEFLVTLWRVMLCGVVVWAACSGREFQVLHAQMGALAAWQVALDHVGAYLAHRVRAVLWEILFFVVVAILAEGIVRWLVLAMARHVAWLREMSHQKATLSVWRNLILIPVVLIYLVEIVRPSLH